MTNVVSHPGGKYHFSQFFRKKNVLIKTHLFFAAFFASFVLAHGGLCLVCFAQLYSFVFEQQTGSSVKVHSPKVSTHSGSGRISSRHPSQQQSVDDKPAVLALSDEDTKRNL